MNGKARTNILLLVTLLIASIGLWQPVQNMVSGQAPEVSFKTLQGHSFELKALTGKPLLVTFWATDCKSCLEEIPHLIELHQQFGTNRLTIIAVAMPYDPPNRVLNLAQIKALPYEIALDPGGSIAQAFDDVKLTPTSFLIDRTGNIVMRQVGKFDLADMQRRIAEL